MLTVNDIMTEVQAAADRVAHQMVQGHQNNDHVQFCRGALGFAGAIMSWYNEKMKEEATPIAKPNGVATEEITPSDD
jgi:hypothetical protein